MSFTTPLTIAPTSISISEARDRLTELMERVHYQHKQFRIVRKDKPMARLVAEPFMVAVDTLLETDSALADTLALMLNEEAMQIIDEDQREWERGESIPLAQALHQE
jgi:prevent-host-death family protein